MDEQEVIIQPRKWVSKEEAKKLFSSNEYFKEVDEEFKPENLTTLEVYNFIEDFINNFSMEKGEYMHEENKKEKLQAEGVKPSRQ